MKSIMVQTPFHGDLLVVNVQTSGERLRRDHIEATIKYLREVLIDIEDPKLDAPAKRAEAEYLVPGPQPPAPPDSTVDLWRKSEERE